MTDRALQRWIHRKKPKPMTWGSQRCDHIAPLRYVGKASGHCGPHLVECSKCGAKAVIDDRYTAEEVRRALG